jgi:hypothetical protein
MVQINTLIAFEQNLVFCSIFLGKILPQSIRATLAVSPAFRTQLQIQYTNSFGDFVN